MRQLTCIFTGEQQKKFTIILSTKELESIFGTGAIQIASQSSTLVFLHNERMWAPRHIWTLNFCQSKQWGSLSCIINFDICKKGRIEVCKIQDGAP